MSSEDALDLFLSPVVCCLVCSEDALDLLRRLLVFNPARRLSAEEALAHPYVAQFHAPADEPAAPGVITIPIDDNTKARSCTRHAWAAAGWRCHHEGQRKALA